MYYWNPRDHKIGDSVILDHTVQIDNGAYCSYLLKATFVRNTPPYFTDWDQFSYLRREFNSGFTVIDISESMYTDDESDQINLSIDLKSLYDFSYMMVSSSSN